MSVLEVSTTRLRRCSYAKRFWVTHLLIGQPQRLVEHSCVAFHSLSAQVTESDFSRLQLRSPAIASLPLEVFDLFLLILSIIYNVSYTYRCRGRNHSMLSVPFWEIHFWRFFLIFRVFLLSCFFCIFIVFCLVFCVQEKWLLFLFLTLTKTNNPPYILYIFAGIIFF